ncbi:acyltransferase family protein [Variovorax sp. RTB1]|uniref:acyltransferase family protein n=1 Tax=Variovorax sp. RTB1 TaxID=3048631 RepID=UPI002B22D1A5|nr:acyltransferase family protein [Variovorax sp. RTB1]MEB0113304.1 acyltransferase family protein [Variovorax sp. RTB1]
MPDLVDVSTVEDRAARIPLLDAVKGLACLVIVGHHLARYGPMSEVAFPLAPALIHWLSTDGRLAVQVFLVIAGFLTAGSMAPAVQLNAGRPLERIARRYLRLIIPYLAALIVSVVVAAIARPLLQDDAVPGAPNLMQLLAHGLLLQDLLGYDALSAGVWYVAIDFQLFALSLAAVGLAAWVERHWRRGIGDAQDIEDMSNISDSVARSLRAHWIAVVIVFGLVTSSLVFFNLHAELDATALYFFGAYGLGMLTFWIGCADRSDKHGSPTAWRAGFLLLVLLGVSALAFEWRSRIAIALMTSLAIAGAQRLHWLKSSACPAWARPLAQLGRMSYSLFLIHFPVILLVSAVVSHWAPAAPWIDAAGMVAALALSLAAAWVLYRRIELRPASWRAVLALFAGLLVCGFLVSL